MDSKQINRWTLSDIDWDSFDKEKVDPDLLSVVKAAALVEYNGKDYATYLNNVFRKFPNLKPVIDQWAVEEVMHGTALGRWAELADPTFNFKKAVKRFRDGYSINLDAATSVRGSKSGEMIARCIVETGTSSFYTALKEAADEPVLKQICAKIAADEFRHYKLFYEEYLKFSKADHLSLWQRLKAAVGRIMETSDDELSYAYFASNCEEGKAYNRQECAEAYARLAYKSYQKVHLDRVVSMTAKACGISPQSYLIRFLQPVIWWLFETRRNRLNVAALTR